MMSPGCPGGSRYTLAFNYSLISANRDLEIRLSHFSTNITETLLRMIMTWQPIGYVVQTLSAYAKGLYFTVFFKLRMFMWFSNTHLLEDLDYSIHNIETSVDHVRLEYHLWITHNGIVIYNAIERLRMARKTTHNHRSAIWSLSTDWHICSTPMSSKIERCRIFLSSLHRCEIHELGKQIGRCAIWLDTSFLLHQARDKPASRRVDDSGCHASRISSSSFISCRDTYKSNSVPKQLDLLLYSVPWTKSPVLLAKTQNYFGQASAYVWMQYYNV